MLKNGPISFSQRLAIIQSNKPKRSKHAKKSQKGSVEPNSDSLQVFEDVHYSSSQSWKLPDLSDVFPTATAHESSSDSDNEDFDWNEFLRRDFFGAVKDKERKAKRRRSSAKLRGVKRRTIHALSKQKPRKRRIRDWTGKAVYARPRINAHLHPWMNVPSLWRVGNGESVKSVLRNEYLEAFDEVHCTEEKIYLMGRGGTLLEMNLDETEQCVIRNVDVLGEQENARRNLQDIPAQLENHSNSDDLCGWNDDDLHENICQEALPTIQSISCGDAHTILVMSDGTMYAKGQNSCHQCCIFREDTHNGQNLRWLHDWTRTETMRNVRRTFCATRCTFVETADGTLLACGENMGLRLGVGTTLGGALQQLSEVRGLPTIRIQKISVGYHHTCVLLEDGSVYAAGTNAFGCTTLEGSNTMSRFAPMDLSSLPHQNSPHMTDITCGQDFTLLLLQDGRLFGVGKNVALGLGESSATQAHARFTEITVPPSIRGAYRLGSGDRFSVLVSTDSVACCGENDSNQLGKHERYIDVPSLQFENASQLPLNDTPIASFCVTRRGFLLLRKARRRTMFENAWCRDLIGWEDCTVECFGEDECGVESDSPKDEKDAPNVECE